jgi:translation initiation factor IF-2
MRVHELAKKLGLSSKDLLKELGRLKVEAKNHMSVLGEDIALSVEQELKPAEKPQTPPVRTPEPPLPPLDLPEAPAPQPEAAPQAAGIAEAPRAKSPVRVPIPIAVGTLASSLGLKAAELIKLLMNMGVFANVNQLLSENTVFRVAAELAIPLEKLIDEEGDTAGRKRFEEDPAKLRLRPPVATMMGHVDHGKTSLLDAIRKTNVVDREAGRITQHIGAYSVDLADKGHVTFLDTPGHAAFTAMRARGANVTDVVVLVVAADDGVMPQTIEAIDHARAAGVPIVVAINKIDLPAANPLRVRTDLQKMGLMPEEWGGTTIFVEVSAKTEKGINELLEMLHLQAEILELKANPDRTAEGTVIEGKITKGHGPVATVLVQQGTLRAGNAIVCGPHHGRVRAMHNDRGKTVKEAGPSYAVEILGLSGPPEAGEIFTVVEDDKLARKMAEKKAFELREKALYGSMKKHITLEGLYDQLKEGTLKELKMILKADVQGSIEALSDLLEKLSTDIIKLRILHAGTGGVNESDVMLAAASDAIIIGFHVKAEAKAETLAEKEGVEIRYYNIIYEAAEEVKKAMEGLLEPTLKEVLQGRAEIRQIFRSSRVGNIGGAVVTRGKIFRGQRVRLIRDQIVVYDGRLASLKRFKDDAKEVAEGFECGLALEGFNDLQVKDLIECYKLEKVLAKL